MTTAWIDFRAVKEKARFEPILERYHLELKARGKELVGKCPFHEETRASFSVNPEKGVFHCFGCSAKGNALDFVARMESVSIRRAAELVAEWLGLENVHKEAPRRAQRRGARSGSALSTGESREPEPQPILMEAEGSGNKPLRFKLKLEPNHPYLAERSVSYELAQEFELGFCTRGVMKDRICIPLHDADGALVGYLGRWPGDPPDGEERYKLPLGFKKGSVLYNLHRIRSADELVLVEGCWSVIRLHALRMPTVALLGRTISSEQEGLLVAKGIRQVTILMDGDEPGREAAGELLSRLANHFGVRMATLPDGGEPDTADEEKLLELLAHVHRQV